MQGLASQPKAQNKSSNTNQSALDSNDPVATSNTTTGGVNTSQGAVNINPENALEKWNRLEASGELENLSGDDYYYLANAATAIENAMSPVSSFYRFNRVVNSTNQYAASLAADLSRKQYNVDMMQHRVAANQVWVDRNTNKLGGITQGFDLEAMIGRTTDWTDMSYGLTPGPWSEGYVFGASQNEPSMLTRSLAYASLTVGGLGSTHTSLNGIAATKLGSYGFGLAQSKGWTMADRAPLSTIFDGSFSRGASTPINGVSNYSFGFGPVDEIKSLTGNISGLMDNSWMKLGGNTFTVLGPLVSGAQAYDYQFNQEGHSWNSVNEQSNHKADIASNWGKFGVDSTFALAALSGVGTIPAGIYGITDFALQASGYSYTPKFHPTEMGIPKKSWTGLMYLHGDMIEANQRVNPNFKVRDLGGM